VSPDEEIDELAQLTIRRLGEIFEQLRGGAVMPAHGAEKICSYCEMRGVCRRGEWEESQDRKSTIEARGVGGDLNG